MFRHAVIAAAFSWSSTATLRVAAGILLLSAMFWKLDSTDANAMPLNHVGGQVFQAPPPPSRPPINLPDIDIELEAREAQARVAERRTIRRGLDALAAINKAESFDGWKAIGAALSIGKRHALKVTGAPAAWGRNYSLEFNLWVRQHGFDKALGTVASLTRGVPRLTGALTKAAGDGRSGDAAGERGG